MSPNSAQKLLRNATSVINIKPGRVGGYLEAKAIHDLCLDRGVPVWCGGMLETGIGRAANVALAALPGFTLPTGGRGQRVSLERGVATRSKKNPGKRHR